jgi:hypothetical protein
LKASHLHLRKKVVVHHLVKCEKKPTESSVMIPPALKII